jgi:hypothetical protein
MSLDDDRLDIDDDAPDLLREALGFARLGWAVFPVVGKEPPVAGAGRLAWSRASSSDSEELVELFGRHPEATGIGLDAGKSGLVVIDADRLPALSEWLGDDVELLDAAHGPKLHGRRDRASWIFAQPAGEPIACPDHPGGEIKGAGGYVVLPPSLHPDISARYEWIVEPAGDVPALPVRIEARIRELGSSKSGGGYADVPPEWLTAGVSCRLVKRRLYEAINEMDQAAQPAMRDASLALLRLGHERHEGVSEALSELTESYVATVGRKRGTKAPRRRRSRRCDAPLVEPPR